MIRNQELKERQKGKDILLQRIKNCVHIGRSSLILALRVFSRGEKLRAISNPIYALRTSCLWSIFQSVGFTLFPRRKATSEGIILSAAQFTSSSNWDSRWGSFRRVEFQREISTQGLLHASCVKVNYTKVKKCFVSLSFGMCVRGMAPTCLRNQTNDSTGCRTFYSPPFSLSRRKQGEWRKKQFPFRFIVGIWSLFLTVNCILALEFWISWQFVFSCARAVRRL